MVSTRPPTSKSSRPFNNPLVTVPKAPITIGMIVTFMFHSFFNSLARLRYLSLFSHSFCFIHWSAGTEKSKILQVFFFFFFLLIIIGSGLLAKIRWSVCMSKSHRSLCASFSMTSAGLCIYHLRMVKFKFLAHFQVDHLAYSVVSSLLRVFHTSVSWWFSTGIWVITCLRKSPGFFLIFRPILKMLLFGLLSPSYFQALQSFYQSFSNWTERTYYNCFHRHMFHIFSIL